MGSLKKQTVSKKDLNSNFRTYKNKTPQERKLFLTSNIWGIKKDNDTYTPTKFSEKNNFLANLKWEVTWNKKFVLISSNPNDYKGNDLFLELDKKALEYSWLSFKEYQIIDNRTRGNIKNILNQASLIVLAGGNTYQQNLFFHEIDLANYLINLDCPIVWISAGAMNCSNSVLNTSEKIKNSDLPLLLEGLGLSKISIEPHFEKKRKNPEIMNILLQKSYTRKIYGLRDGSYIFNHKIYGKCEVIENGEIRPICNDNQEIPLDQT